MDETFKSSIDQAERLVDTLNRASSQLKTDDYLVAEVMVGVAQGILTDLQCQLSELKLDLDRYARLEKALRETLTDLK